VGDRRGGGVDPVDRVAAARDDGGHVGGRAALPGVVYLRGIYKAVTRSRGIRSRLLKRGHPVPAAGSLAAVEGERSPPRSVKIPLHLPGLYPISPRDEAQRAA
jgi:hypothetical protein